MREDCLSIGELLDLRASAQGAPPALLEHVKECPRCAGLMRTLPEVPEVETPDQAPLLRAHPVTSAAQVGAIGAGQLWRASAPDVPDRRYVVVVIGRRKDASNGIVAAPTSTGVSQATDLDVVIEDSIVGYPFLVAVWSFGTVLEGQLEEYLGSLTKEQTSAVRSLYSFVVAGDSPGIAATQTGVGTSGPIDDRNVWRAEYLERLRPLWRPWHKKLIEQEARETLAAADQEGQPFSAVLRRLFQSGEWDAVSLAEAAHVETNWVENLLTDRLDLTDQTDADSVAALVRALELDFDEVEPNLRRSLQSSPGGLRMGVADIDRIAARTFADVTEERRNKELYEGLARVDESEKARRRAIESYLQTVVARLDELDRR